MINLKNKCKVLELEWYSSFNLASCDWQQLGLFVIVVFVHTAPHILKERPCLCIRPSEFCQAGINSAVILPLTTKIIKEDAFPLRVKVDRIAVLLQLGKGH